MASYDFDIGIIGGGSAGLTVASGSAQLGAKTLLIEKEKRLGGDCLHYGCIPSKTLIKTANVYHLMKNAKEFGLPEVDLPPVDFKEVSKRIKSVIDIIQKHDSEERFCSLGVKVEFGEAAFTDEHTVKLNGKNYSAKNWVLATGSSPVAPPIPGMDKTSYITNKDIFYLDHLPKSMIILGGGPIGTEMGQAFNRLGTKVTIMDRADQILGKEDKDMADGVMTVMISEGVVFHIGASIQAVKDLGAEKGVIIKDRKGKVIKLQAETILVAMGRSANTYGLGLEDIGLKLNRAGIKVDKRLRTNHKHIYAAGDVNGGFQFTHAAGYEGGIVISNAIFRIPKSAKYTAFKDNDRSLAENEKIGKIKMILDEKEKPIGVQILGPHAGDLLSEWIAVMNGKVKLSTLASAVHPYPTIGEINKKVAGTFFSPKIFSDKIRKGLKFFFHLRGRACGDDVYGG
jgi:pyruvate/2-oxoglutarate dehydrogenase complex dihydrolipoamide dehydrogenase (E3) component